MKAQICINIVNKKTSLYFFLIIKYCDIIRLITELLSQLISVAIFAIRNKLALS